MLDPEGDAESAGVATPDSVALDRVTTREALLDRLANDAGGEVAALLASSPSGAPLSDLRALRERGRTCPVVLRLDGTLLLHRPPAGIGAPTDGGGALVASALAVLGWGPAPVPPPVPRLVDYLGSNPDIIFRFDRAGTYLDVITLKPELLLVPPHELLGSTVEEVLPTRVGAAFRASLHRVLESGQPELQEIGLPMPAGTRRFEVRLVPAGHDEAVAIVRDVTEARMAQVELERRERFLGLINSQVPAVLWTTDLELRFTSSSGSGLQALGLTRDEVVGVPLHDFFGTADPYFPAIRAHLEALGGASTSLEVEWAGLDFACQVEPLHDDGGEILGTIGVALDVSERNRVNRELAEREALLRQAQEVAGMGSWTWDVEADRLDLSEPLLRLYGRRGSSFDGRAETLLAWIHPDDRDHVARSMSTIRDDRQPTGVRFRLTRPDGALRTFDARAVKVGDSRFMGTVIDVTERVHEREALRRSREQLRNLAERLHLAREGERRAVAREVHDVFGQALTGARIDTVWLRRRLDGEDARVRKRIDSLCDTVEGLLETARDLSERLRPPVLDELGLEAALTWQLQQVERRTELVCSLDLPPHRLELDDSRATALFRIGQEALTNVVRHAGARRVHVSLTLDGTDVVLTVEDDGGGIAPESASDPRSIGLTGMAERARSLGGETRVGPRPEGGTRVATRLPLAGAP